MLGPMLRALLEDRFRSKIHRETREIPVYDLTVARGGLKMQAVQPGRLHAARYFAQTAASYSAGRELLSSEYRQYEGTEPGGRHAGDEYRLFFEECSDVVHGPPGG